MVSCLQASIEEALLFFSGPATFPASSFTFQKLSTPPGAYEGLGRTACNNLNIVTKKKCPCPQIFCSWQVTRRCLCQRAPRGTGRWAEWTICLSASSCPASVGREDWFQRWYSTWILIDLVKFGKYHQYVLCFVCLIRVWGNVFFQVPKKSYWSWRLCWITPKANWGKGELGVDFKSDLWRSLLYSQSWSLVTVVRHSLNQVFPLMWNQPRLPRQLCTAAGNVTICSIYRFHQKVFFSIISIMILRGM